MILSPVLAVALTFALGCFALALVLSLIRLFTAPTLTDRILAVDTMTVNTIALIVLLALRTDSALVVEIALLFALTGFVSTVAFCKHLLRGSIIE
ncbi:K+/H+ antiporter subunit F [Tabrizicola sp.]|uniref:K+/H+ antiporter subunit F n=1 Tax=Tabrizicola sp. TaxID=2005166 RepID=UPI002FDC9E51